MDLMSMRQLFFLVFGVVFSTTAGIAWFWPPFLTTLLVTAPLFVLGVSDLLQRRQTIKRNFPLLGHFRYLLEEIRPEVQQYFIENNEDGMPFSREARNVVYQRAKGALDTIPFGTQHDVYKVGYEWINHSLMPKTPQHVEPRVLVGGKHCKQPYSSSRLNISAMSY